MTVRVLLADDSIIFRSFWHRLINELPGYQVVASVGNGKEALRAVQIQEIDLVILDLEMPVMDGISAIPELLKLRPEIKILIASAVSNHGGRITLDALSKGAHDFIAKPKNIAQADVIQAVRQDFQNRVFAVMKSGTSAESAGSAPEVKKAESHAPLADFHCRWIAIGSSTGGPNALVKVLHDLPEQITQPILIVQHMPPVFTEMLAERLSKESKRIVVEAKEGDLLQARQIYVAPGGRHMGVRRDEGGALRVALSDAAPENFCRPAVDYLFRSIGEVIAEPVLYVVLTGMGEDGLRGCQSVPKDRSRIIAQDEASSVVWGMPGAIARAGVAHEVLPLDAIQRRMGEYCA